MGIRFSRDKETAEASITLRVARQDLMVGKKIVTFRTRIQFGVRTVDAIYLRRLEHGIAAHFGCAKGGSRVRGEERIARAGRENHEPVFFSMCLIARLRIYGSQIDIMGIADCTRVGMSIRSSVACNASAFMTVANISR